MMDRDPYVLRMQELLKRSVQFNIDITEAEEEELSIWMEKVEEDYERRCEEEDRKEREAVEEEYNEFFCAQWGYVASDTIYPLMDQEVDAFITAILQHLPLFHKIAYQEVKDYIHAQDKTQCKKVYIKPIKHCNLIVQMYVIKSVCAIGSAKL